LSEGEALNLIKRELGTQEIRTIAQEME